MSQQDHETEVDLNFNYFQSIVTNLMAEHAGQHVVLRHQRVDSFYDSPATAFVEGYKKFPDGLFSVQKVTTTPIDLGFYSHVAGIRSAPK
jgi:hypothetical protein